MFHRIRIGNTACIITSTIWLAIYNRRCCHCSWNYVAILQVKESGNMTIVVKKVPKFLRGFVKLIFGIKEK